MSAEFKYDVFSSHGAEHEAMAREFVMETQYG